MAGTMIVSLDFELFWGMLDCSTLESYGGNVVGGRKAIPRLLELFQKYNFGCNCAVSELLYENGTISIVSANQAAHLQGCKTQLPSNI